MKAIESIALHFLGNTVTVYQKDGLFCLNDLHRAYTGGKCRKGQPRDWIKWNVTAENTTQFEITKYDRSGTYANEQGVYAYAAWLDADFHSAVLDTFSASVRGDGEKAVKIAQSAVTLAIRESLRERSSMINDSIYEAVKDGSVKGSLSNAMANVRSLVCKAVTGLDGTAFKSRYGMSSRDFLTEMDDYKRLTQMERIEGKVEALLDAGMDYMSIKSALARDVLKAVESWDYEIPMPAHKAA